MKQVYIIASLFVCASIMHGCSNKRSFDGNVEVIPIDFDKSEKVSMGDIFSHIEVISLEESPDAYLKDIDEIYIQNNNYYIKDHQTLFVFDSLGNLKYNTRNRYGRGSNEYFSMNGHFIEKNGDITVMDWNGKILRYDPSLNLKESYKVPLKGVDYYDDIFQIDDDILVLSTSPSKNDSVYWNFYSISKRKIVGSYIKELRTDGIRYGGSANYIRNDNQVLFRAQNNGYSLYRVNPGNYTIEEAYRYEPLKDKFDPSKVDASETTAEYLDKHSNEFIYLKYLKMSNKYIVSILGNSDNIESVICFYSLEDGRTRLINRRFNNEKFISMDYLDDSAIYFIPYSFEGIENAYDDSLLDEDSRNRLKNVNDDTNALIFKYYLRDDIL